MSAQAQMQLLGVTEGKKWYWAEPGKFSVPGVYYWDGQQNVHVTYAPKYAPNHTAESLGDAVMTLADLMATEPAETKKINAVCWDHLAVYAPKIKDSIADLNYRKGWHDCAAAVRDAGLVSEAEDLPSPRLPADAQADEPYCWCIAAKNSADWAFAATRDGVIENAKLMDTDCVKTAPFALYAAPPTAQSVRDTAESEFKERRRFEERG